MNVIVRIAAKSAKRWTGRKEAEVRDDFSQGGVVIGSWYEDSGIGQTQRMVLIAYDQIPEMIAVLARAQVDKIDRDRKATLARLEAQTG